MKREIVDLGLRLAEHMMREDILNKEIVQSRPSELESEFLESCMRRL